MGTKVCCQCSSPFELDLEFCPDCGAVGQGVGIDPEATLKSCASTLLELEVGSDVWSDPDFQTAVLELLTAVVNDDDKAYPAVSPTIRRSVQRENAV